jgi:hypothetical protein
VTWDWASFGCGVLALGITELFIVALVMMWPERRVRGPEEARKPPFIEI